MAQVGWLEGSDDNYVAVVILDDASGDSIEIQRSLHFDAQDVALGMDTYCIVRDGASHYGGLIEYRVFDESVEFTLDVSAAEQLELPEIVEIPIDAQGAQVLRMRLPLLLS